MINTLYHGEQTTCWKQASSGSNRTYAYRFSGHLTLAIVNGGRTTSTFDAADQETSSVGPFDTLDHQFDADANQVGVSAATTPLATFTWDYEDRLKSAEIDGLNLRITALYDSDHRRIARTQTFDSNTDSSRFNWDGENVLQVTDNSNVTKVDYTLEPSFYGKLISQKQGADSVYHHFDALGSTQQLTDAMGVPIDSYDYTAFGAGGPTLDAIPNLYQFVGELGYSADNPFLLYIRRRWYFTFFGRWASRDKATESLLSTKLLEYVIDRHSYDPDAINLFAHNRQSGRHTNRLNLFRGFFAQKIDSSYCYAGNDPVIAMDPSGYYPPSAAAGAIPGLLEDILIGDVGAQALQRLLPLLRSIAGVSPWAWLIAGAAACIANGIRRCSPWYRECRVRAGLRADFCTSRACPQGFFGETKAERFTSRLGCFAIYRDRFKSRCISGSIPCILSCGFYNPGVDMGCDPLPCKEFCSEKRDLAHCPAVRRGEV